MALKSQSFFSLLIYFNGSISASFSFLLADDVNSVFLWSIRYTFSLVYSLYIFLFSITELVEFILNLFQYLFKSKNLAEEFVGLQIQGNFYSPFLFYLSRDEFYPRFNSYFFLSDLRFRTDVCLSFTIFSLVRPSSRCEIYLLLFNSCFIFLLGSMRGAKLLKSVPIFSVFICIRSFMSFFTIFLTFIVNLLPYMR